MNKTTIKNIVREEYNKIKENLQEQSMGGQSMSPGGQPFSTPSSSKINSKTTTVYIWGIQQRIGKPGDRVELKTLKQLYDKYSNTENRTFEEFILMLQSENAIETDTINLKNQIGLPNDTDKTTMALLAASSGGVQGGLGGTGEKLFVTAILGGSLSIGGESINLSGIKTDRDYKTVDDNIKSMLQILNNNDKSGRDEYIYLRNGKASAITNPNALPIRTGLQRSDVFRNASTIVNFGIINDKDLDSVGFDDTTMANGIFGLIESEFGKNESERINILLYLVNKGLADYNKDTAAITPNIGTAITLEVPKPFVETGKKIKGITQYQL